MFTKIGVDMSQLTTTKVATLMELRGEGGNVVEHIKTANYHVDYLLAMGWMRKNSVRRFQTSLRYVIEKILCCQVVS